MTELSSEKARLVASTNAVVTDELIEQWEKDFRDRAAGIYIYIYLLTTYELI